MASGAAKPRTRPSPVGVGPRMHYDQIIDQKLAKTRRRVKLVDLGILLMGLVGGIILFTMSLVLLDHWALDLSKVERFVALGILIVGVGAYLARFVIPTLTRPINPRYAARAIEQSEPSLKNSVINFLMFRRDPTPTGRLVYRALQQRAALDLRGVNVDLAVDQSRLIHVGYVVVALMILLAGYTILSPKNVFQTIKRVSIPWADIARPSRVTIDDIQPGNSNAILGSQVRISARIVGATSDDIVRLLYTTQDNQTVDRVVSMNPPETGQRYTCTIPADALGIQQNLKYRIEAGDAKSGELLLTMVHTPSIVVDRIEYQYPAYTGMPPYTSKGEGEVHALEGTIVTVHAKANHAIKTAQIEFDPDTSSPSGGQLMASEGDLTSYAFTLRWDDTRNASEHSSYQIDFTPELSVHGVRAAHKALPAVHKIQVTPDLPPEISILTPRRKEIDVPVNGMQRIEMRALDPDFGLSEITLQARARDREDLTKSYPQESQGRVGQVVIEFEFRPTELHLQPGDQVQLWAEATDNCTQPNRARTSDYTLNIVAADAARSDASAGQNSNQNGNDQGAADNKSSQAPKSASSDPQQGGASQQEDASASGAQDPQDEAADTSSGQQDAAQGEESGGGQSDSSQQGNEGESGDSSAGQPQEAQQGEETEGNQTGEGGQMENGSSGNDSGDQQSGNQSGASGSAGSASSDSGGSEGTSGNSSGNTTGQQPSSSDDSGDGSQEGGAGGKPTANSNSSNQEGAGQGASGNQGTDGAQSARQEPLHDGEAIERTLEYMKKTGQQGAARDESPAADHQSSPSESTQDSQSPADSNRNPNEQKTPGEQQSNGSASDQMQQDGTAGGKNGSDQAPAQKNPAQNPGNGESEKLNGSKPAQTESDPSGQQGSGQQETGQQETGQRGSGQDSASDHPGKDPQHMAGEGDNADPQKGLGEKKEQPEQPKTAETKPESSDNTDTESAEKQSGLGDEGSPGTGRPSEDKAGSTASQRANQDTEKKPEQGERESSDNNEQSSSESKKQSDSQGDEGGPRSGGGEKGGGQSANQPGRDSPGSSTSSDQGNTGSPESGQGETANRGGDKQQSPDKTGQSGEKPGNGTQSQPSSTGDQQTSDGSMPKTPQDAVDPDKVQSPNRSDQMDPNNHSSGGLSSGKPDGGGIAGDSPSSANDSESVIPDGDAANLDYARRATDLALAQLKNQQDDPDPELLKSLGWTKDELKAFIARWEAMKHNAREQGGEAQRELQDALRSLGLRSAGAERRATDIENDNYRGMHDGGNRSRPPADMLEQFNAYRKGAARGQ